ncbi:MAG TPA: glycosyltransferase family 4 protein [Stellaceae bacterium]|nr:glycosyltransferase family 4 protein [Stellaceae bacterium]
MRHQNVLALVTDAYGGRGGIAQYNCDFLSALAGCGTVLSITVMPRHAPDPALPPARVRQAPPRRGRLSFTVMALVTALSRRVDLVFCGHLHLALVAASIAYLKGAKLIIQMHGVEAWRRPSRLRCAAIETADLVLCVSRHTRARVVGWADIPPERVMVLPNTIEDIFRPKDSLLRTKLAPESKRMLLTVGRMDSSERYKGHDRVIAALPAVIAKGHDLVYVVVGDGDDQRRLRNLAREVGVAERVRFLGRVGPERLADLYRATDLFVMPSTGEGFGIAFLEALASGTPALGLNVAGAADALGDGELGTLVSEDELAVAIDRLLSAPSRDPHALSESARAKFGRDAFGLRVCAALDRIRPTA